MMVEHYAELRVPPGEFMEQIGEDKYLSANDLAKLMRGYGLVMEWGLQEPRIVLLNGNHWVVYLGDGLYHDPLYGPYQEGWLGSGLYVEYDYSELLQRLEK
jgi:hypothetical protein